MKKTRFAKNSMEGDSAEERIWAVSKLLKGERSKRFAVECRRNYEVFSTKCK